MSMNWGPGYTAAELDRAQERFGLVFPPDLVALLRDRRPMDGHDWTNPDEAAIRKRWPGRSKGCCSMSSTMISGGPNGEQGLMRSTNVRRCCALPSRVRRN
jgi:hypothetical protein